MDIQSVHLLLVSEAGREPRASRGAIVGIDFIHDAFPENPPSTMTLDYVYGLKCDMPYCTSIIPRTTGYIGKELLQRSQCPLVSLGVVELSCNVSFINESTSNPWGLSPIYLHVSHAIPLPQ